MKKFRLSISFFVLVIFCLLTKQFFIFFNYLLALFLHEIAHLIIAKIKGYHLKYFKLDMLGMSIELDTDINNRDSFAINIAGPLCNMLIAIICVACYWLIPNSFYYLNYFCVSNLVLALFNLLPIYPLDGGKIFRSIIKSDKAYKYIDLCFRLVFFAIFAGLFIWSSFDTINWFYFIMAAFFLIAKPSKKSTLSIFKNQKDYQFEKIVLLKVDATENLYSLIKHINKTRYTIFYINQPLPIYLDEDKVLSLALNLPLTTQLNEIKLK